MKLALAYLVGALIFTTAYLLYLRHSTQRWLVIRTTWPYREGHGTAFYLWGKRTIVDTGLSREAAEAIVHRENTKRGIAL